jgi:hypothetical protein
MGIIVPAYFYPGTGGPGGVGDGWAAMAAAAGQVPITAVFNPDSGPLPGPADPNYVSALTNLENSGGKVVAYVYTDYGNVPIATVEGQMATYVSQYGSLIGGFFLDGMSNTPSTLSYYQTLDSYVKGLNSSDTVIGNPGVPDLNGLSTANYLSDADIYNTFEGSGSDFSSYPNGATWVQSQSSSRFLNIVYNVSLSSLAATIAKAIQDHAGSVYITDQSLPNPYSQLPSYWDQEVAAIHSASTPLPTPLASSLVLCGLIVGSVMRRNRNRSEPI